MNYADIGNHECAWRNKHSPCADVDTLEQMLYDAYRMSEYNFRLLYGAYRYYAPDNSIRVVCNLPPKEVTPFIKPRAIEHKNTPRKGDLVTFVSDDDETPTY